MCILGNKEKNAIYGEGEKSERAGTTSQGNMGRRRRRLLLAGDDLRAAHLALHLVLRGTRNFSSTPGLPDKQEQALSGPAAKHANSLACSSSPFSR
jgi:hypothetical protein